MEHLRAVLLGVSEKQAIPALNPLCAGEARSVGNRQMTISDPEIKGGFDPTMRIERHKCLRKYVSESKSRTPGFCANMRAFLRGRLAEFFSVLTLGISQKDIFGTGVGMDQISLYANALEAGTRWIYVGGIYAIEEGNCVYSNVSGKCNKTDKHDKKW